MENGLLIFLLTAAPFADVISMKEPTMKLYKYCNGDWHSSKFQAARSAMLSHKSNKEYSNKMYFQMLRWMIIEDRSFVTRAFARTEHLIGQKELKKYHKRFFK